MERMNLKEKLIRYIIVIFFAVIWIIPLYMAVITPFKSIKEIFRTVLALPQAWKLDSFLKVFQEVDIWHYLKNSFVITGGSVVILGILSSLATYAMVRSGSRLIKGSYLLFSLGLMIPTQSGMIALFNTMQSLHLYNTTAGMVLAYVGCSLPVSVFLYYGFLKSIPYEIIESSYIDGCSEWKIYTKMILPLSTSAFGTVVIYNAVNIWKDFTYPLLFTQGEKIKTLPIAIYAMKGQYVSDYPTMFAGILIATLPLLMIYIALQKQFIAGVTAGAVKG